MYQNLLSYFIECVKNEAKESIQIKDAFNNNGNDKFHPVDDGENGERIKRFFFSTGEYSNEQTFQLQLTETLNTFISNRVNLHGTSQLYLALEYIEIFADNVISIYPLYFIEVSHQIDNEFFRFSMLDYEPYFNLGLYDVTATENRLPEEEKFNIRSDISEADLWTSKISIYKNNLPENLKSTVKFNPLLFIGDIPKIYEWVAKEIESIKQYYHNSIDQTSLKYFISNSTFNIDTDYNAKSAEFFIEVGLNSESKLGNDYLEIFELNKEQELAVSTALNTPFTVITGPPGTGKSQVVLNLLANLTSRNKTVLIASKNNKAVNTILEKLEGLRTYYLPFVRLGNKREKSIGKEKLVNSLQKPDQSLQSSESRESTDYLRLLIHRKYNEIEEAENKFQEYHLAYNLFEEEIANLETYKEQVKSENHIFQLLQYIDQSNNPDNIDFESIFYAQQQLNEIIIVIEQQLEKCSDQQKRITPKLVKLIEPAPSIITSMDSETRLKCLEYKKNLQEITSGQLGWIRRLIINTFNRYFRTKYLNRYKEFVGIQENEIRNYFFDVIQDISFTELHKAVQLYEDTIRYTELRLEFQELKHSYQHKHLPELYDAMDKKFVGLKPEIIKVVNQIIPGLNFIESVLAKKKLLHHILTYIKLIRKRNETQLSIRNKHDELKKLSEKSDIDLEIRSLKQKLVNNSILHFSSVFSKSVENNKPGLLQNIKIYYDKWRDNELQVLFDTLKSDMKIWVTTNLATTYNLPNRPAIFDYVIIDEASQNDIVSIVPLLFRAKNAVIIGDPNQLRHITNLNDKTIREIADRTGLTSQQLIDHHYGRNSAFDLAKKRFINATGKEPIILNNHYRSYKDIINFANIIVKDYKLFPQSFINIKDKDHIFKKGMQWYDVPGIYQSNKTNPDEVKAIVKYLKSLSPEIRKTISIGIITPFSNQGKLIREALNSAGINRPDTEPITADTVHKFQGDEKDIILYSPVIAPNIKAGTLKWADSQVNLLNVAVTRARTSFIVFGNMEFCRNKAILHSELINYVNTIHSRPIQPDFNQDYSGTEQLLYHMLKQNNIIFDYQVPVDNGRYILDFVIKAADHFINIELDGRQHRRSISQDHSRDERVRQLGYQVMRFTNEYIKSNINDVIIALKKVST